MTSHGRFQNTAARAYLVNLLQAVPVERIIYNSPAMEQCTQLAGCSIFEHGSGDAITATRFGCVQFAVGAKDLKTEEVAIIFFISLWLPNIICC